MNEILVENLGKCNQENCNVLIDGQCLEGLEIDKCPHYFKDEDNKLIVDNDEIKVEQNIEVKDFMDLYSGESLTIEETKSITYESKANIIILAGPTESGKTTLISTLIDCFQKGKFAGLLFAGSKTLIGFEKLCFESRIRSGRQSSDTERTKNLPPSFYHLKLCSENNKLIKKDLLIANISGEKFKEIRDSKEESRKFSLINRADHFTLFFDCGLLTDLKKRQEAKASSLMLLRRFLENEQLNINTNVEIVFSKWDLILIRKDKDRHIDFVKEIENDIFNKYNERIKKLIFFKIASRPKIESELNWGYGLNDILIEWFKRSQFDFEGKFTFLENFNSINREFSKFKYFKLSK